MKKQERKWGQKTWRMCKRKKAFHSSRDAGRHISKQADPGAWKSYSCPECRKFHIAHRRDE